MTQEPATKHPYSILVDKLVEAKTLQFWAKIIGICSYSYKQQSEEWEIEKIYCRTFLTKSRFKTTSFQSEPYSDDKSMCPYYLTSHQKVIFSIVPQKVLHFWKHQLLFRTSQSYSSNLNQMQTLDQTIQSGRSNKKIPFP